MRNARAAIAAITTLSLAGAVTSFGGAAHAASTGVGTSQVGTTVASVQLGTNGALLGVRLLGDDARSTIDSKVASAAEAFSRFTGVSVTSDTVTNLKALSSPTRESRQPGGEASVTTGSVNLSNPDPLVTIPSTVVSGTIGLTHLSSEAAATLAKSALSATLTNASVGGGLASVTGVTSGLTSSAASAQSDGSRSVKIDQVVVLDLGAVLTGLGLPLSDLPVATATALVDKLGQTVSGVTGSVQAAVDNLQTEITTLVAQLSATTPVLPGGTVGTVVNTINGLGAGTIIDSTTQATLADPTLTVTAQLNGLIDALQAALADVLEAVLSVLDGAPLLKVDSVDVGVTTKAADTVANSVGAITAKIGAINVGAVNKGSVDATQALTDINTTVTGVNDTLKDALDDIDPGLANLVSVSVFERAAGHGVSEANGYVKAVDGITGLKATVTPPTTLSTILGTIQAQTSIADEITAQGGTVPSLSAAMGTLGTTLNNSAAPLAGGATVTLASVNGTSEFAPSIGGAGSGGPGDETDRNLSATGSNDTLPMTALALLLIALGLGFREWIAMPVRVRRKA